MKKIFMVCYGGGHVKIIKNIYLELIKEKEIEIVLLALTGAQKYLSELNIPYMTIEKYYNIFQDKEIKNIGEKILKELNINFEDTESKLYYGYSFKELIEKYGIEKSIQGYKEFERRIFLPINFMNKVLKYEKPDLVITTNAPRMEKAALIASKELGIKSISVEDLFGVEQEINEKIEKFFQSNNYRDKYGNYVCVLSEEVKKFLENKTDSKVIVTGNPNFDDVYKYKEKKLFINENMRRLCYLSQKTDLNKKIFIKLLELLENKIIDILIVKIHPNEDKNIYKDILRKYEYLKNKLFFENNLYEAILKSNLVITEFSTAGIEAAILGREIISRKNKIIDFEKLGMKLNFNEISEIENLVESYYKNKSQNKSKFKFCNNSGSKNIKKLVINLLK